MKLLLSLILAVFAFAVESEGTCFEFYNNSYLHFTPNNFNSGDNIHYSLKFRTSAANGIILYARGRDGDDEALYIRNGKLTYHLFNQEASGIGGQFGGYYQIDQNVNIGDWVEADVYRMWNVRDVKQRRYRQQTGITVKVRGQLYTSVDFRQRSGIDIIPTIYIGGYRDPLSETVGFFNGAIKEMYEEKNDHTFEEPSFNYMSLVGRNCLEPILPN